MRTSTRQTTSAVLRGLLGIKVPEMAALLKCSEDAIKSLETGRLKLSDYMAERMSQETGISLQWLIDGDAKAPPISVLGQPYTEKLFHLAQATKGFFDSPPESFLNGDALDLWARLAAILTSASNRGEYQMAAYKAMKAIQQLGMEFGQDLSIYEPTEPYHYPKQALKIVKRIYDECSADAADPMGRAAEWNRQQRAGAKGRAAPPTAEHRQPAATKRRKN